MRLNGYAEVRAVCTHPDYQGCGYAKALVQKICRAVFARGEAPFLHVFPENLGAIQAYERLGFVERRQMHLTALETVGD